MPDNITHTDEREGVIIKSLSGFYYVASKGEIIECRARGRMRREGVSPLVGDVVKFLPGEGGKGTVSEIIPRRNSFIRPAVANVDYLVIIAAPVIPITDPYLIDRVIVIARRAGADCVLCVNKTDVDAGDSLVEIYSKTPYKVIRTSAVTGEGLAELRSVIRGKTCAFTGNSGVGKSSILNALDESLHISVGEVSQKLGRGRHTTRHVELFDIGGETYIADTPGFASFDVDKMDYIPKDELQYCFDEFAPYIGQCRFNDCAHINEPDCAVTNAVKSGEIHTSRHDSYVRLYEISASINEWELK